MLYDPTSVPNVTERPKHWAYEEVILRGDILFIITYDDTGRGSIQTRSGEEAELWRKILTPLKVEQKPSGNR